MEYRMRGEKYLSSVTNFRFDCSSIRFKTSLLFFYIFIVSKLLLLGACSTNTRTDIASQWPLQVGSDDVYQYYEGEPLPLDEVAILEVRMPLGIMKRVSPAPLAAAREHYYSGKFAIKPGKQVVPLSYFRTSGLTYYATLAPFGVPFYAEKGRRYQTFYLEKLKLYLETNDEKDLKRFLVEIYDVTDREALTKIAESGRYKAFQREAKAMLQKLESQD